MTKYNGELFVGLCVLLVGFALFVGIPTDEGMYFGYFWRFAAWLATL